MDSGCVGCMRLDVVCTGCTDGGGSRGEDYNSNTDSVQNNNNNEDSNGEKSEYTIDVSNGVDTISLEKEGKYTFIGALTSESFEAILNKLPRY